MKNIKYIKDTIPIPWSYLLHLKFIYFNSSIESNNNNYMRIIFAFLTSISFIGFIVAYFLNLEFDFSNSVNKVEFGLFLLTNAIPLSIIYSLVMYLVTIKNYREIKNIFNFILQVIKFFIIGNVLIASFMLIAIDELMINQINIFNSPISTDSNHFFGIVIFSIVYVISFIFFIFKPTYQYLSKYHKWYKTTTVVILALTAFFNNNLYSLDFYPKNEPQKLIIAKKFCKEVLDITVNKTSSCKQLTIADMQKDEEMCIKLVHNSLRNK